MTAVPQGWATAKFEDVIRPLSTSNRSVPKSKWRPGGPIAVVGQGASYIEGYTERTDLAYKEDLPLLVFGPHTKRTKFVDFPFVVGPNAKVLAPRACWDRKLLAYLLAWIDIPDRGYSDHFQFLRGLMLPLPPIREQHRIVEAIESYFTQLDAAVATLERVQRSLKRYRASVLKAAVEGQLVPTEAELARAEGRDYEPAPALLKRILAERRRRWEETELAKMKANGKVPKDEKWKAKYKEPLAPDADNLPELPQGWCWAAVDQLAEVGTGATPKRGDSRYWSGGEVPWVTSAVVNKRLVRTPSEYVTRAALAETNLCLYQPGTLLIAMYGEGKTRGRATVLAIEATTNQALAALELPGASRQVRDWLLRFFEHNYLELRKSASGGVQPNLNLRIVRSIFVPIPPLREQERMVAEIDRALSIAEATHDAVTSSVMKATRLRQSILKWAFEGRLVDQDPTDEPASRLLERIQAEDESTNGHPRRSSHRPRARSPKP